jgi:hypothetical protein
VPYGRTASRCASHSEVASLTSLEHCYRHTKCDTIRDKKHVSKNWKTLRVLLALSNELTNGKPVPRLSRGQTSLPHAWMRKIRSSTLGQLVDLRLLHENVPPIGGLKVDGKSSYVVLRPTMAHLTRLRLQLKAVDRSLESLIASKSRTETYKVSTHVGL